MVLGHKHISRDGAGPSGRSRLLLFRVPDAVQREAHADKSCSPGKVARSGAPLIRDRHRLERSRVCSASLRAALRPGHEIERAAPSHHGYRTVPVPAKATRFIA
jgi:hypothetical protein